MANFNTGYSGVRNDNDYNMTELGAYHMIGNDDYEPQRQNNFEVRIYFGQGGPGTELTTVGSSTVSHPGRPIKTDEAEKCLILSTVSVGQIQTEVGVIEIPYGNTKVKYAGLPTVQNSDIVYNDYIGKATERIIAAWHGQVFNPQTQKIGRASVYKKPGLLIETAPDGTHPRIWELKGCWPSNVTYGGYDYNTAGVRQITMTLTYDIAIPWDN